MKLYTQQIGSGPDLVLLHGWGFHSAIWSPILPTLAKHFRLTLIDLPGFGRSHDFRMKQYDLNTVVQAVLTVAPKKAAWLGWSLGGVIAMQIAIDHPEKITHLVLVSSTPCFLQKENWPGMKMESMKQFAEDLKKDYKTTMQQFLTLQFYGDASHVALIRQVQKQLLEETEPQKMALTGGLDILRVADLRDRFRYVECPITAIFGRLDIIVPVEVAEKVKELNTDIRTVIIEKASHAPFLSHPEATVSSIMI